MIEYNVKSERAEEFIHDGEIRATLEYALKHKDDKALIEAPMYLNTIISWAALHDWDSYEFVSQFIYVLL